MCTLESSRIAICAEKLQKQRIPARWQPNEGKSWPTRLRPDLQTRPTLAFCCSRQISGKKNSTLFLVLGPLFTWNLFGSWNARFANSPTQLPLKSSVHTHAWNLIAWNCGVGFDFTEKLFVNEEKSRLGGFVRPTCYLKSTAPYWAEVQFTQTDQYWLSMNLPRFRFYGTWWKSIIFIFEWLYFKVVLIQGRAALTKWMNFRKSSKGGRGVIFNPKIKVADFGPLNRFF